jgi:hypothetical protein
MRALYQTLPASGLPASRRKLAATVLKADARELLATDFFTTFKAKARAKPAPSGWQLEAGSCKLFA